MKQKNDIMPVPDRGRHETDGNINKIADADKNRRWTICI